MSTDPSTYAPLWMRTLEEMTLCRTVDPDKIEASFKNGVLKVTLPKKPEAQKPVKKIEVKGG